MEPIKIENFSKRHPVIEFPQYKSLTADEAEQMRQTVAERLRLPCESTSLELIRTLREKSMLIPGTDAESDNFNLEKIIADLKIAPRERVFLNWNRFDKIDEIALSDLSRHFDDIWYPAVDDIDIFDETIDWIVSIGYSGEVLALITDNTDDKIAHTVSYTGVDD